MDALHLESETTPLQNNQKKSIHHFKIPNELEIFCHECCSIDSTNDNTDIQRGKRLQTFFEMVTNFAFCYGFQYVIHLKFCDAIFKCGCTWRWKGGWIDCNIWSEGYRNDIYSRTK